MGLAIVARPAAAQQPSMNVAVAATGTLVKAPNDRCQLRIEQLTGSISSIPPGVFWSVNLVNGGASMATVTGEVEVTAPRGFACQTQMIEPTNIPPRSTVTISGLVLRCYPQKAKLEVRLRDTKSTCKVHDQITVECFSRGHLC
jgi:hypothetical protein